MTDSDGSQKHGEVLDEILREEIKGLTLSQIQQVIEYIEKMKQH